MARNGHVFPLPLAHDADFDCLGAARIVLTSDHFSSCSSSCVVVSPRDSADRNLAQENKLACYRFYISATASSDACADAATRPSRPLIGAPPNFRSCDRFAFGRRFGSRSCGMSRRLSPTEGRLRRMHRLSEKRSPRLSTGVLSTLMRTPAPTPHLADALPMSVLLFKSGRFAFGFAPHNGREFF